MSFGPDHYVPVLKVKRGEKSALQAVAPGFRARITPLLEIVERTKPTVGGHLDTAFKDLGECLQGFQRCFLDAREIASDGPLAAEETFHRAQARGIPFTPVTGVSRTEDVLPALNHNANGLALRLTREEFEAGIFPTAVQGFLNAHCLAPEGIDLIVDLGPVVEFVSEGVAALTNAFLSQVPDHNKWRTFTISASAFPQGMGVVQRNSHALVERTEWVAWRDNLRANAITIPRVPTFSDCAIQHPIGVEGFDPIIMQVSASVRYTLSEHWLLIKGEGTKNFPARDQFPMLATQLVYGNLSSYYMGPQHCKGCEQIERSANGEPRLGSAEVWRRIGTVHHISKVMQDL